jgi:hypothetical protein
MMKKAVVKLILIILEDITRLVVRARDGFLGVIDDFLRAGKL